MAVVLLVWLVLALLLSLSGALHQVPLPMPMLGGMITVVLLAVLTVGSTWRARTLELGFRPLIAIHLTRFVGFYFLWLYSLGVLARNFAVPAGWGDVIVAVLAIPLVMMRDGLATRWRTLLIAWNLIGLADILVVVVLAFRMSIADPGFQNAFASLPLSLLPLYIVPLVIASHGVMLYKLAAPGLSTSVRTRTLSMLVAVMGTSAVLHSAQAPQSHGLPSETPAQFTRTADSFDYVKRDVMIPMRDGVKLHTIVLVPRGAKGAPILLTRTPYDARVLTGHAQSAHLGPILSGYDNATDVIVSGGYIRAVQDVRGKYGSEGDYVMNRPLHGRLNPTSVDHATDTSTRSTGW